MAEKQHFTVKEAETIDRAIGIDWKKSRFDVKDFWMGLHVELEHGRRNPVTNITNDDPMMTGKIALAHLNEFADYYKRLDKMEKEAERAQKRMKKRV